MIFHHLKCSTIALLVLKKVSKCPTILCCVKTADGKTKPCKECLLLVPQMKVPLSSVVKRRSRTDTLVKVGIKLYLSLSSLNLWGVSCKNRFMPTVIALQSNSFQVKSFQVLKRLKRKHNDCELQKSVQSERMCIYKREKQKLL